MSTDNTANDNFANRLMNNQSPEAVLTLQLTNFKLQMKGVDKRVQLLENSAKDIIDKTQSTISKLVKNVFKNINSIKEESISAEEIEKTLTDDENKIKKSAKNKTENCNNGICDKISIFKKTIKSSLSKTVSFFGDVISGKYFSANSNLLSNFLKSAKNNIRSFFGGTVGKMFDWVYSKGAIVFDLLSKALYPITSVLKWLTSGAITIIEGLYNKFISLAKIGWKVIATVWDIISEKAKSVMLFFKDAFMDFISSPIGFVLAVGAFILAINYVIKPAINFLITVGEFMWTWILKSVDKIFFNSDKNKREMFFDNQIKNIELFFKSLWNDYLVPAYDKTIGALTGLTSVKISSWFEPNGLISQYWEDAKKLFFSIVNTGILEDIPFILNAFKTIWDVIKYISNTDNVETFDQMQRREVLTVENKQRMDIITKDKLNSLAETNIFQNLLTFYNNNLKNWNLENENEVVKNLTSQANILFENFKKNLNITKNKEENKRYIDMIDINLNDIVTSILGNTTEDAKKIIESNKYKTLLASETIAKLKPYYDRPDIALNQTEDVKKRLDYLNSKDFENSVIDIEKNIRYINLVADVPEYKPIPEISTIKAIKTLKSISNTTFGASFDYIFDRYDNLEKSALTLKNYVEKLEIQHYKPQKAGGIIAKYPTRVLIAEAGDPELIVPINKDGIDFIKDSMLSILNEEAYNKNKKPEKTERETLIQRIKKQQPKPDSKIYDMKNICYGVIGVAR